MVGGFSGRGKGSPATPPILPDLPQREKYTLSAKCRFCGKHISGIIPPAMPTTSHIPRRRVIAAVALDTHSGQRKLDGMMRFFNETLVPAGRPWDFEVQPNSFFVTPTWAARARDAGVAGVILLDYPTPERIRLAVSTGLPCVIELSERAGGGVPEGARVAQIACDARALAREAAMNLVVRQSFASFGFVHAAGAQEWTRDRCAFFRETLAGRGRDCAVFTPGRRSLGAWLAALPKPAAVCAANDETARRVADACLAQGIAIPAEAAVLGFDDDPRFCLSSAPSLSSVVQDFERCGRLVAETLERMMDGDEAAPHFLQYGARGVAIRESTLSDSPHAALVQRALEVIDANAHDPAFGVEEVARRLGVSRRLLDLRFREIGRKSVHEVIRERRLEQARRLLVETARPIEAITHDCGFTNRTHLKKLFLRTFGCSMREWRNRSARG